MTTTTEVNSKPAKKAVAKKAVPVKVPPTLAKAVAAVPEFAAALADMAQQLAAERHTAAQETARAEAAEAALAQHLSTEQVEVQGLRADLLEVNRILNWYGGTKGWCSDYEYLQRLTNERLTQYQFMRRPGYGEGYSNHEVLPDDPDWKCIQW